MEVYLHSFLTLALNEGEWSDWPYSHFNQGERTSVCTEKEGTAIVWNRTKFYVSSNLKRSHQAMAAAVVIKPRKNKRTHK